MYICIYTCVYIYIYTHMYSLTLVADPVHRHHLPAAPLIIYCNNDMFMYIMDKTYHVIHDTLSVLYYTILCYAMLQHTMLS